MKIKIKEVVKGLYTEAKNEKGEKVLFINPIGDCIDLRAAEDYEFEAPQAGILSQKSGVKTRDVKFDTKVVSLGLAVQLPKGLVGRIVERSSGVIKLNVKKMGGGYIDNCYRGDNDVWKIPITSMVKQTIHKGDRICQFHIELSQFATPWQKLKWLFSKPKFIFVDSFNENNNRGGFGKTGVK